MLKEIRQIINEFAQKEGYNLILEKAEQFIIYNTANIDVTDKIISLFNQKTSTQKGKK
jgi:outer membrane protein